MADDVIEAPASTPPPETIGREAVVALLERHNLPALQSLETVADGNTLLINGEILLRLNRQDPDHPVFTKEALIYRRLRRSTDVPGPEVLALDTARDLVPYDVLILSRVAGDDGAHVWAGLNNDEREALSEEAGRVCGTIHGLQWAAYGDYNVSTRTFGQYPRWSDMLLLRAERAAYRSRSIQALPLPILDGVVTELNDGDSVLETASPPVLVHGEFHTGNLRLVRREDAWHISAITGWSSALTADAAWEFGILSSRSPERAPIGGAFLYGYRERHAVPADLRSRMHLYRLMFHLEGAVMANAAEQPDAERRQWHEQALRRLLQK